jgi:hypothetical protein
VDLPRSHPSLRASERDKRIAQGVNLHWHLMVPEVRKRLEQSIRQGRGA